MRTSNWSFVVAYWCAYLVFHCSSVGGKAEIFPVSSLEPTQKQKAYNPSAAQDKVLLTVVQFADEDPILKWFLRIMSILMLVALAFLWAYYR